MTESSSQSDSDASSNPVSITDQDSFEQFVSKNRPVVVDLYADWCGPCQQMAPRIEELARRNEGAVGKVNVDEAPELANKFNVHSIPTFLIFEDSEVKDRLVGMQELEQLEQYLD